MVKLVSIAALLAASSASLVSALDHQHPHLRKDSKSIFADLIESKHRNERKAEAVGTDASVTQDELAVGKEFVDDL